MALSAAADHWGVPAICDGLSDTLLQIKRMEMEARSFSPERARTLLQKVKEYKADLASLRQEAKQVTTCTHLCDALKSALLCVAPC